MYINTCIAKNGSSCQQHKLCIIPKTSNSYGSNNPQGCELSQICQINNFLNDHRLTLEIEIVGLHFNNIKNTCLYMGAYQLKVQGHVNNEYLSSKLKYKSCNIKD